ncbi:MAG: class II aldolase/adducin family protein [Chthoniobacterales bacterium]
MSETGVVKFSCEHVTRGLKPFAGFAELNACRQSLRENGLIGVDADGIGYGNVSMRDGLTSYFFITSSGTGRIAQLGLEHYAKVTAFDFDRNWIRCEGHVVASSESLTHAAIYECDPNVHAVIHCHSAEIWKRLLDAGAATGPGIEYGTPAMAYEVRRLFAPTNVRRGKVFAMAGHENGVVAFGSTLEDAWRSLTSGAAL